MEPTLSSMLSKWHLFLRSGYTDPNCVDFEGFLLEERRAGLITEDVYKRLIEEGRGYD